MPLQSGALDRSLMAAVRSSADHPPHPLMSTPASHAAAFADPVPPCPTEPADVWNAPLVPATEATTAYARCTDQQLLTQLRALESTPGYPHASMLAQVRSTLAFCKAQLRRFGLRHTAFSFNGGKDCTVLLHLLRMAFQEMREEDDAAVNATASADGPSSSPAPSPSSWSLSELTCIYFQEANEFDAIQSFMSEMSTAYSLSLAHMCGSFKLGLIALQASKPIRAIFMGQRAGDPGATAEKVAHSDKGWPDFDRVNPLIEWSYDEVWIFLRQFRLPYCTLYEQGYTSLGHKFNTAPNPALLITDDDDEAAATGAATAAAPASSPAAAASASPLRYRPAWQLLDPRREREGRFSAQPQGPRSPIPGVGAPSPSPSPPTAAAAAAAAAAILAANSTGSVAAAPAQ